MAGSKGLDVALTSVRILSYSMLGYGLFYLATFLGLWYSANILSSREDKLEYDLKKGLTVSDLYNQVAIFVVMPVVFSAALGGLYEALWKLKNTNIEMPQQEAQAGGSSVIHHLQSVVRFQFRPLVGLSPWMSVGEFTVLVLWLLAMGAQLWQGVANHGSHYHERAMRCPDNPSSWCWIRDFSPAPTPEQYRLRMVAIYFGFVGTTHLAAILIPVSRDSKLWAALGIPFERAVLYHVIAGHLAFSSILMHGLLFVIFWVWDEGWAHAVHESINAGEGGHGGVDVPAGWMAFLCGIPMWITSINYVRRRWYSLFKLGHWMFIGVLLFGAMHWAPNAIFYLGGLTLYALHISSRLSSWKRWRYWNRWLYPKTKGNPSSLANIYTNSNYTRLVLHNPKSEPPRGGALVYISVPGALGTDEAHAITVALRGPPPGVDLPKDVSPDKVHTLYVKSLGLWTEALCCTAKGAQAAGSPRSLLVDVDGFYNHIESFTSMMTEGFSRVVLVAGGSGVTSFMCLIQDWAVAASRGQPIPEVHLAWCCRDMEEMELVGEAIPSILSIAGRAEDTHFKMSLYCSSKKLSSKDDLSVTWPLHRTSDMNGNAKRPWSSLYDSFRIILAGGAGYGGFLLGTYESNRRDVDNTWHEGGIIFTIMVVVIVGVIILEGWIRVFFWSSTLRLPSSAKVGKANEESKVDLEASQNSVTYPVGIGRVRTHMLLTQEAQIAKDMGAKRVKVLASGPNALVDGVLAEARKVNWHLFDTEAFSFEF